MGKLLDGWHSGQVVRKHTMMNLRADNNAEHTWGVIHILLSVFSEVSTRQIIQALYHDFGERATGDIPGPVLWNNPELAKAVEEKEYDYMQENLVPRMAAIMANYLTAREKYMLEFADRIEFCFSMYREYSMGNKYALKPWYRSKTRALAAWENLKVIDTRADTDIREWWPEMIEIERKLFA